MKSDVINTEREFLLKIIAPKSKTCLEIGYGDGVTNRIFI